MGNANTARGDAATLCFELDITRQSVGGHIGGRFGAVIKCPVCGQPACAIGQRMEKGKVVKQYAHGTAVFSTPVDQHSEWTNLCEKRDAD